MFSKPLPPYYTKKRILTQFDLDLSSASKSTSDITQIAAFNDSQSEAMNSLNRELAMIYKENKKLKKIMEEHKYEALNLKNEYVKLKEKSFWLKCEIECKTKEFEINLYKERENPDCFAVLLDLNTLHNNHTIKYHQISEENDILRKKIEKFQGVKNTHEDLFEEVQILKWEISENLKKIKDMKNNLKRNSPQESPEFESQLKTMKSIFLSRKEPSFQVKIELDELKLSCENLNTALKIKQDQIEEAEVILLEKEHEINVATNEINDKKEAMKRLSNAILESKAIQAELLKEIRILKNKQKTK